MKMSVNILAVGPREHVMPKERPRDTTWTWCARASQARHVAGTGTFHVFLVYLDLDDDDAIELLTALREDSPDATSLLVVGYVDMETAVRAVNKARVNHVLQTPLSVDTLATIVGSVAERLAASQRNLALNARLQEQHVRLNSTKDERERRAHENMFEMLEGFLAMLQVRAPESEWHARRVSLYALGIARVMGFRASELIDIARGALLHDIGTIGIPDALVFKAGALSPDEEALMRAHPLLGYQFLESFDFLADARDVVLQHHERYDGEGYPLGLSGDAICIGARVFAVADSLESMTSVRTYRPALSFETAYREILSGAGTLYDPAVVEAFTIIPKASWEAAVLVGKSCEHGTPLSQETRAQWERSEFVAGFCDGDSEEPWRRISLRDL